MTTESPSGTGSEAELLGGNWAGSHRSRNLQQLQRQQQFYRENLPDATVPQLRQLHPINGGVATVVVETVGAVGCETSGEIAAALRSTNGVAKKERESPAGPVRLQSVIGDNLAMANSRSEEETAEEPDGTGAASTVPLDFSFKKRKGVEPECSSTTGNSAKRECPSNPAAIAATPLTPVPVFNQLQLGVKAESNANEMLKSYLNATSTTPAVPPPPPLEQRRKSAFEAVQSTTGNNQISTGQTGSNANLQNLLAGNRNLQNLLFPPTGPADMKPNGNSLTPQGVAQSYLSSMGFSPFGIGSMPPGLFGPTGNGDANGQNQNTRGPRPFKAYNPADPISALQLGYFAGLAPLLNGSNPPTGLPQSTTGPALNPLFSLAHSESLLAQYRQYLIGAQNALAAASGLKHNIPSLSAGADMSDSTTYHKADSTVESKRTSNGLEMLAASLLSKNGAVPVGNAPTPSPPQQVTSTTCSNPSSSPENRPGSPPLPISQRPAQIRASVGSSRPNGGSHTPLSINTDDNSLCRTASNASANGNGLLPMALSSGQMASDSKRDSMSSRSSVSECSDPSSTTPNGQGSNRRRGRILPEDLKDEAYWERRRKNNEAAKRSRDARRAKEDEIAIRAALLEQENMKLRIEVAALKSEIEKLRQMLVSG